MLISKNDLQKELQDWLVDTFSDLEEEEAAEMAEDFCAELELSGYSNNDHEE